MLISEYYREYTDQKKFGLGYALEELVELLTETATGHWREIPGEVSDISIFLQLWMYTKSKIYSNIILAFIYITALTNIRKLSAVSIYPF